MRIIIVEGARGAGKTTLVQKLRDTLSETMVLQLTGLKKTETEKDDVFQHYLNLQEFLNKEKDLEFNLILDRSFFTEQVMAALYKSYDFAEEVKYLTEQLVGTGMDITVVHLTLDEDSFEERLQRPGKVEYQNLQYKAESSIKEQKLYNQMIETLKDTVAEKQYQNIRVMTLSSNNSVDDNVRSIVDSMN